MKELNESELRAESGLATTSNEVTQLLERSEIPTMSLIFKIKKIILLHKTEESFLMDALH